MDTRIPSFLLSGLLSISSLPSALAQVTVDTNLSGSSSVTVGNTATTTTSAETNATVEPSVRTTHGKFVSNLHRNHPEKKERKEIFGDIRHQLQDFFTQIRARVQAKIEAAREACKSKDGTERDQCLLDAKVSLQAKVKAMLDAALSVQ